MNPLPSVAAVVAALRARGVELPPGNTRVDRYGDSPEQSESLLALIRDGRKQAGASLLWAFEADNEPLPRVGDIEIVVDHRDEPVFITRVLRVRILPFREVAADHAAAEGEGDGSLEYWRKGHWAFFTRACERLGRAPSDDMPVVCCEFEVLSVLSPPGE